LGVLAGDTIRAAADLKVPVVALTLLYRRGYFRQKIDASGWQIEEPVSWRVEDFLTEMPQRATVAIEGRNVQLRAWKREVPGAAGAVVPVYFLDADLPENAELRSRTFFTAEISITGCVRKPSSDSAELECSGLSGTAISSDSI